MIFLNNNYNIYSTSIGFFFRVFLLCFLLGSFLFFLSLVSTSGITILIPASTSASCCFNKFLIIVHFLVSLCLATQSYLISSWQKQHIFVRVLSYTYTCFLGLISTHTSDSSVCLISCILLLRLLILISGIALNR